MIRNVIAALLAATLVACGGGDDSGGGTTGGGGGGGGSFQATCHIDGDLACETFVSGYTTAMLDVAAADCADVSGIWSTTAACSATNRLGTCTWTISAGNTAMVYATAYYDSVSYTAETRTAITTSCTSNAGTWTAG